MNRDDIIRMAREAGAMFDHMTWVERDLAPIFERFAALVAAAEREACAKVCANLMTPWDENTTNHKVVSLINDGMRQCAAAIRARGEQK